jgi:hypothetical protein
VVLCDLYIMFEFLGSRRSTGLEEKCSFLDYWRRYCF